MDKIYIWFGRNRKPIGYVIGGLNFLSGISYALQGQYSMAAMWLILGCAILLDTWKFK